MFDKQPVSIADSAGTSENVFFQIRPISQSILDPEKNDKNQARFQFERYQHGSRPIRTFPAGFGVHRRMNNSPGSRTVVRLLLSCLLIMNDICSKVRQH